MGLGVCGSVCVWSYVRMVFWVYGSSILLYAYHSICVWFYVCMVIVIVCVVGDVNSPTYPIFCNRTYDIL